MRYLFAFSIILLFQYSCSFFDKKQSEKDTKGEIIAEVNGNYLYEKDLEGISLEGISEGDSNLIYKNYIENWVKEQLIFHKALVNLTDDEKDMEEELNQYYHSLIKYKYIEKIVEQRLSRNVSDEEIKEYYNNNIETFTLKQCLIRLTFIQLPIKAPDLKKVKKWSTSTKGADIDLLYQYCIIHAIKYNLDDSKWFYADDLMTDIPVDINICKSASSNRNLELSDTNFVYLFNIREIKKTGSTSPLEFENERIKHIILHKRRVELIKKVEESIFNEGIEKNYFTIYEK